PHDRNPAGGGPALGQRFGHHGGSPLAPGRRHRPPHFIDDDHHGGVTLALLTGLARDLPGLLCHLVDVDGGGGVHRGAPVDHHGGVVLLGRGVAGEGAG